MFRVVVSRAEAKKAVETIVRYIESSSGELREGLVDTGERVVKSWDEIFAGYSQKAEKVLESTFNAEGYDGIVLLKEIEFHSTCEHHLQPFTGKAHVAYIPVERIIGISKLARLVDLHTGKLQNQERITKSIADDLEHVLSPLGCAVIIEGSHGCMTCRGVKKQNAIMTTSAMRGVFFEKSEARAELMLLIQGN